jgi:replication initiator protein
VSKSKEAKEGGVPAPVAAETNLRKAVEAIAVKPHAGKLTLLTRKIANVLLAEAQDQGVDQTTYRIPLSRLCMRADYDSTNMVLVKDQLRKMASTTVEWNVGSKGARRWGVTNMINVEVIEEGNRCWIEWDYPVKLKAKLLAPDVYARLSLQMQNSFRSSAALALYEICLRYVDSPGNLTMRMAWDEWRPMLTGVPDGEDGTYTQYKYFKRDVIKPSVAEVNTLTHLEVELIEHKQGRAVSELQFAVRPKGQGGLPLDEPNLFDLTIVARLTALGFTQVQAEKLYSDHDESRLRGTLDYVEKRVKQSGAKIERPQAYFRDALAKGYGAIPAVADQKKAIDAPKSKAKPGAATQNLTQKLADAWWSSKRQAAKEAFEFMDEAGQEQALADFEASGVLPAVLRKKWQSDRIKNPMCAAAFSKWLLRDIPEPTEAELLLYGHANGLLATVE